MSSQLSTADSVKQNARRLTAKAGEKMKLASSAVTRGDTRVIDVAIIKATSAQTHVVPKEKHVRTLRGVIQTSGKDGRIAIIQELLNRLKSATDWLTALKTLMVFHRLMHDCGSACLNGLVQYDTYNSSGKGKSGILNMSNFLDTTNIDGRFDYSEWVRAYGRYLDETLDVWSKIAFFAGKDNAGETSSLRDLSAVELLRQLPILQKLQERMMDCKPGGAAKEDPVVQAALFAVLKESFRIYKAVSEGIINLADKFFEMEYLDAQKGLEMYKESIVDNARLQEYYAQMQKLEPLRNIIQFPKLESLPADFLTQMEEYVKDAPRNVDSTTPLPPKKSPPLRRGMRAKPQPKQGLKIESNSIEQAQDLSIPAQVPEPAQSPPIETNLMDLADSPVSEAQPQATEAIQQSPIQSAQADDYLAALTSPVESEPVSFNTEPSPWQAHSPQTFSAGSRNAQPSSPGSANASFWPQSNQYFSQGNTGAHQSSWASGSSNFPTPEPSPSAFNETDFRDPFQTAAPSFPSPRPSSMQQSGHQAAVSMNGSPILFSSHTQGNGLSNGPALQNGTRIAASGGNPGSGSRRALMLDAQLAEFDGAAKPKSQAPSGLKQNAPAPSIVAGLTRPQNSALAKEAALHDPFLDLARLDFVSNTKSQHPIKSMKASGQTAPMGQLKGPEGQDAKYLAQAPVSSNFSM